MNLDVNENAHEDLWKYIGLYVHVKYPERKAYLESVHEECPAEHVVVNNLRQIIGMEFMMRSGNNERYYYGWWLYDYPDEAKLDELMEIASDKDLMTGMLRTFMAIMEDHLNKNSLYSMSYMSGPIDETKPIKEDD